MTYKSRSWILMRDTAPPFPLFRLTRTNSSQEHLCYYILNWNEYGLCDSGAKKWVIISRLQIQRGVHQMSLDLWAHLSFARNGEGNWHVLGKKIRRYRLLDHFHIGSFANWTFCLLDYLRTGPNANWIKWEFDLLRTGRLDPNANWKFRA